MEKQEFLEKLRLSLNGKIAPETMADTLRYYDEYIDTEIRSGRTGEEVMESLGDPRLIARTIAETKGGQMQSRPDGSVDEPEQRFDGSTQLRRLGGMPGWVWLLVFLAVVILIISVAFKLLSAFWPFLLVLAIVVFFTKRSGR